MLGQRSGRTPIGEQTCAHDCLAILDILAAMFYNLKMRVRLPELTADPALKLVNSYRIVSQSYGRLKAVLRRPKIAPNRRSNVIVGTTLQPLSCRMRENPAIYVKKCDRRVH